MKFKIRDRLKSINIATTDILLIHERFRVLIKFQYLKDSLGQQMAELSETDGKVFRSHWICLLKQEISYSPNIIHTNHQSLYQTNILTLCTQGWYIITTIKKNKNLSISRSIHLILIIQDRIFLHKSSIHLGSISTSPSPTIIMTVASSPASPPVM